MTRLLFQTACLVTLLACFAGSARAAQAADTPPTVFDGAYQGLLVGGMAGVATGYLFARRGGWNSSEDWKPLVYGAGIGALGGAAIGLTLGIVDLSQRKPGRNGYVMRDGLYGAGLGAVLGGIAGSLAAISSKICGTRVNSLRAISTTRIRCGSRLREHLRPRGCGG